MGSGLISTFQHRYFSQRTFLLEIDRLPLNNSASQEAASSTATPLSECEIAPGHVTLPAGSTVDTAEILLGDNDVGTSNADPPQQSPSSPRTETVAKDTAGDTPKDWSAFTGIWVDRGGSFFGGAKIEITDTHWRPLNPPQCVHQTATFRRRILSDTALELLEIRSNGDERRFQVSLGIANTLTVRIKGIDAKLQWILHRNESAEFDARNHRSQIQRRSAQILFGAVVLLLVLGVATFCLMSGYDIVTGIYLVVQVVTTVGFGDIPMHSAPMKLFMVTYILLCVPIGAYGMNIGAQYMLNRSTEKMRKLLVAKGQQINDDGANGKQEEGETEKEREAREGRQQAVRGVVMSFAAFLTMVAIGTVYFSMMEACTCSYDRFLVEDCVDDTYENCIESGGYKKSVLDSFYMCITMLTTVGFGDISPRSLWGRVFCSVYAIVGCLTTAHCISELTSFFFEEDAARELKCDVRVTQEIFKAMDQDGKGHVTRADFTNYMLVSHNLVKQSELDAIRTEFDKIDVDRSNKVSYGNIASRRAKTLWHKGKHRVVATQGISRTESQVKSCNSHDSAKSIEVDDYDAEVKSFKFDNSSKSIDIDDNDAGA